MTTGSCLCGTVRWRTSDELTQLSHCHCGMCRKAHAAPFATFTSCAEDTFEWVAGEDNVGAYASSPELVRRFCKTCGGSLPGRSLANARVFMPAGSLDGDPGLRGGRHLFVAHKAGWHTIGGDLEQHEGYPAGPGIHSELAVYDTPDIGDPEPGALRGSCLCGDVAYKLTARFAVIHNCHCSLCRRNRAAAHATNGFVKADEISFTRGEDLLTHFTLPERKYGQSFCSKCGSGMPRVNTAAGICVVPLGSLDDDTDQRPADHIFVGSKAPWYEIADDIPQFEEFPS